MAAWRMAMIGRYDPADGSELDAPVPMWDRCRELGVAAICYPEVENDDFNNYTIDNPPPGWRLLKGSRPHTLKRFLYRMEVGDVIYVKQGTRIVGRGVISGKYQFDSADRIRNEYGAIWRHQLPVSWCAGFEARDIKVVPNQPQVTIVPLTADDVTLIENAPRVHT